MPEIKWFGDWPEEVKGAVEPVLAPLLWLCPLWCQQLSMHYRSTDAEGNTMTCSTHFDYRYACLTVYPGFMDGSLEKRHEDVVHELLHTFISPLVDYARATFTTLMPDAPQFHSTVMEQLRERLEGAVCDLAFLLAPKIKGD